MHKLSSFSQARQQVKRFLFFAECILVRGALRGIIYDLNRCNYRFVPNELINLIDSFEGKTINDVYEFYGEDNKSVIDEYFIMLEDEEFIFWVDEDDIPLFPKLNLEWDYPAHITNAIIDIDEKLNIPFEKVFRELTDLGCKYIQIRSYDVFSLSFWNEILGLLNKSSISCVEVFTKYSDDISIEEVKGLFTDHLRLAAFVIHSSPEYVLSEIEEKSKKRIVFVKDDLKSNMNKNQNHSGYFSVNILLFTEAQKHHSYFNRKVSFDVNGEIKNCPSLSTSFGNINEVSINKVLKKDGFKRLWNIEKDETLICKDCEFRYMCVDTREPFKNADGFYYHKQPCSYDPYTAKWK